MGSDAIVLPEDDMLRYVVFLFCCHWFISASGPGNTIPVLEAEVNEMEGEDLPLGFSFALAQNPDAMKAFSNLSKQAQTEILQRAHAVSSKGEMQSLVNSLAKKPKPYGFDTAAF